MVSVPGAWCLRDRVGFLQVSWMGLGAVRGAGLARCGIQVSARQAAGRCGSQVGAGRASSAGFSHMPTAGPKACGIKKSPAGVPASG